MGGIIPERVSGYTAIIKDKKWRLDPALNYPNRRLTVRSNICGDMMHFETAAYSSIRCLLKSKSCFTTLYDINRRQSKIKCFFGHFLHTAVFVS